MSDLKILFEYFKENKTGAVVVIIATIMGAILGVIAFYNGWLG